MFYDPSNKAQGQGLGGAISQATAQMRRQMDEPQMHEEKIKRHAADCIGQDVQRQAPAAQALNLVFETSEHLSALLSRLEEKLTPVLTPTQTMAGAAGSQSPEVVKAPFVSALGEVARRQIEAIERVQMLLDRLAV